VTDRLSQKSVTTTLCFITSQKSEDGLQLVANAGNFLTGDIKKCSPPYVLLVFKGWKWTEFLKKHASNNIRTTVQKNGSL